jgi:hypothetical protein
MAQVGSSNEPLTETAGFAYTGSLWVPVSCDASGNLNVIAGAGSFADALNKGYIGSAWQNDPLRMGYSSDVTEAVSELNAVGGTNVLYGTACPAGEIWNVQAISARNNTRAGTYWEIRAQVNSIWIFLAIDSAPAAGVSVMWSGNITLSQGDRLALVAVGCVAGDDLYLEYHGVTVDIDQ